MIEYHFKNNNDLRLKVIQKISQNFPIIQYFLVGVKYVNV